MITILDCAHFWLLGLATGILPAFVAGRCAGWKDATLNFNWGD